MRQKLLLLLCFGMFLFTGKAFSQDISVSGTVKNEKGEPISAASIKIKFSKGGTIADDQGNFSIKTSIGKILVISALGYESKDVQAESEMNIVLKQSTSANALTDVVVTANGIRREQRSLGYDAPTLKSDELMQGQSMSILTALTGRVAGVNITSTTGAPGGSTRVVLRGGSSITGSNNALIVVDGIPYSNTLINGGNSLTSVDFGNTGNDISPNDVASITVLEGPSAAALYGSRASNGALIITTKTGSSTKKQEITFSTSNTFSSILKLPDFQNEYGQGYSTASFGTQDSIVFTPVDYGDNFSWGIPFDGVVRPWGQTIDGVQLKKPYSADKNNVKDFFKTGFVTNNNVSISSGTDKMNYFLGLNAENSNGVYPGNSDTYNRYSVRFNGKAQLSNNFTASINFNYTNIGGGYVAQGQASGSVLSNIYQTPRDIPLNTMGDLNNKYNSYGYTDASGNAHPDQYGFYALYTLSPYYILQNFKNNMNLDRATGGVNLIYQPTSWLNITDRITTDFYAIRTTSITPKFSFYPADPGTNGQYQSSQIQQNVGNYSLASFNLNEVNNDLMVTAKHKFENGITGSVLIGNNIYQNKFNTTTTSTNVSGGL
ncbi:MAG TPA: TonB-dependent receptor plug domain-containing protein, partial [Arachidicoccus soli]|nr:TonB-dependent receptor plug domain-containing protein [Arachidicoccus soli]